MAWVKQVVMELLTTKVGKSGQENLGVVGWSSFEGLDLEKEGVFFS